ncbi:hypothetical protein FACS1894190_02970 [Spirochaetia bacterium]|nr:hypothetical protein FACS1894190_02970 [Spirochaetia bacterium]
MEINNKNGNIIRVSRTVSLNSARPKIRTIKGVKTIPKATAKLTKKERNVQKQQRNSRVSLCLSSIRNALNVGIKATAIEPSAKSLRKRFGIINATENASDNALVPSRAAFVISRTRPSTRDISVKNDSAEPDRSNECFFKAITISLQI